MKKTIIVLIVFLLSAIIVFSQQTNKTGMVNIEVVDGPINLKYTDRFNQQLSFGVKQHEQLPVKDGWLEIEYHSKGIKYWLRVGEYYYVKVKNNLIFISSDNIQAQTEANFFAELESICPTPYIPMDELKEFKKSKNPAYRDSVRLSRKTKSMQLLDYYRQLQKISEPFYNLCKTYLQIKYYTYPTANTDVLLTQDDFKGLQNLQCEELLFSEYYRRYITSVASKSYLEGKNLEYLHFSQVLRSFSMKDTAFPQIAQEYIKSAKNPEYTEYITGLMIQITNESKGMLTSYLGEKKSLSDILKAHKGRIVYIDFWSTWCTPCMAEIPNAIALHEKLPTVSFIYLSMDNNINVWRKAVVNLGLEPQNCFLIDERAKSPIIKQFNIKAIPHYLIFDKNGKLFNIEAPRPSNTKELIKIFDLIK